MTDQEAQALARSAPNHETATADQVTIPKNFSPSVQKAHDQAIKQRTD